MYVAFLLFVPLILCHVLTLALHYGRHDCNSLSEHINHLEQQVNTLQYEFESELRATLIELVNLKSELKASHEEQNSLRRDLGEKCQLLKMTSSDLKATKYEIDRLKVETKDVKLSCSQRPTLNVTKIVGAINSTVSFKAEFEEELRDIHNNERIKFNKIITNDGGGYNVRNGTFEAPISGYYMVWVDIYIPGMCSFINVLAQKEGEIIGRSHIEEKQEEAVGESVTIKNENDAVKENCFMEREGEVTDERYIVLEEGEINHDGLTEIQVSHIVHDGDIIEEDYVVYDDDVTLQGHTWEKGEIIGDDEREVTDWDSSSRESGETIEIEKCYPCKEEEIKLDKLGLSEGNVLRKASISFVTHLKKGEKLWLTKDSGCSAIYSHDRWPRSGFGCILLRQGSSN